VPDQIQSNEVIPSGQVTNVHRATLFERTLDALPSLPSIIALGGIIAVVWVCIEVLFSQDQHLMEYRSGAWAILSGFAGACVTYFFGDKRIG
jgi:hypothetical protein